MAYALAPISARPAAAFEDRCCSGKQPGASRRRPDTVPRGAPDERPGSVDAVVLAEVAPPAALAQYELSGRLRPPRPEVGRWLMRERRAADLIMDEDVPGRRRLLRCEVVAVEQSREAVRQKRPPKPLNNRPNIPQIEGIAQ